MQSIIKAPQCRVECKPKSYGSTKTNRNKLAKEEDSEVKFVHTTMPQPHMSASFDHLRPPGNSNCMSRISQSIARTPMCVSELDKVFFT